MNSDTYYTYGEDVGCQSVLESPISYNLYTKNQYDSNYSSGYNKGYSEGYAKAVAGVNVVYTYHQHTGNSSAKGGCYQTPQYHQHMSSCYTNIVCNGTWYNAGWIGNGWSFTKKCSGCDATATEWCNNSTQYDDGDIGNGRSRHNAVIGQKLSCGKDGQIIGYALSCGKTTSTVESATVKFK